MTQPQMIEGATEEVTRQMQQSYAGQKLRVIVEAEAEGEDFTANLPDSPNTIRDAAHLERLLLEGIHSGPATPMTEEDWQDIRQEVHRRHTARRTGTPASNA